MKEVKTLQRKGNKNKKKCMIWIAKFTVKKERNIHTKRKRKRKEKEKRKKILQGRQGWMR